MLKTSGMGASVARGSGEGMLGVLGVFGRLSGSDPSPASVAASRALAAASDASPSTPQAIVFAATQNAISAVRSQNFSNEDEIAHSEDCGDSFLC